MALYIGLLGQNFRLPAKILAMVPGEIVETPTFLLPALFIIHTVRPIWIDGNHSGALVLRNCYKNAIQWAQENKLHRISFPNISTGVYGFPKVKAAEIAKEVILENLANGSTELEVVLVCYDLQNLEIYKGIFESIVFKGI